MQVESFTAQARAFLDANATRRPPAAEFRWGQGSDRVSYFGEAMASDVQAARAWQRVRHDGGFGWITGPAEYGGRELTIVHAMAYDAVEAEYDVPDTGVLSVIGLGMIGPTILAHGTPEQRERYLRAMYRGDVVACQLFSEPGAGSDLAGVATRAVRDGDGWVLDGQKVWTSIAQHADVGMALCRTNPEAPKHKGITAFLVDLAAPGVEIRPLRQMTGGADFNEVFLTGVRVPDSERLGDVDAGWRVAMTTLMNERVTVGSSGNSSVETALTPERLAALMRATGTADDPTLRSDLSGLLVDMMATRHLNERTARSLRSGVTPGPEGSIAKLAHGADLTRAAHFVADVLGPRITADTGEWGSFAWTELLLAVPALRILGGTEEIMKNILAERVLGLPKEGAR